LDNYNKTYAKVEASYLLSHENEVARLEEEHDRESKNMSKAADAEREWLVTSLEKMQRDLKISREKQKAMAAELRYYQDKEMRDEEALEEESQARAKSGSKHRSEDGDEEKIFDVDFHDEDKSNKWGVNMRKRIVKLLVIKSGLSSAKSGLRACARACTRRPRRSICPPRMACTRPGKSRRSCARTWPLQTPSTTCPSVHSLFSRTI
jgi:hypothetical protein